MRNIVLTGAAGFAGSHCLRHLLANTGATITCPMTLDHMGHLGRVRAASEGLEDGTRVRIVPCNLAQPLATHTKAELGSPDVIINYASASHVDRSIIDPVPFVANNVSVMLNVLEYARGLPGLQALIHVNSDECFGPSYDGELFTEDAQHRPSNPYSASKSAQSQLGFAWWRTYGVPFMEVYGCNMFGEHAQNPEKFFPKVMACVAAGETVPIHSDPDGRPGSRFWQHARNVADAILFVARNVTPDRYGTATVPSRFNVTSGDRVSNLVLARIIASAMRRPLQYTLTDYHSSRPGHDLDYGIDGARLHALGWQAPVSFDEGVRRTVAWELANAGTLAASE